MKLASVHLEISFPSPVPATRPVDELRSSRSGSATRGRESVEFPNGCYLAPEILIGFPQSFFYGRFLAE